MSSFVHMTGELVRDPEVRYLDTGRAVANFTVLVKERGKEGKESLNYIRCSAWGDLAVRVGDQARDGTRVSITGRLNQRAWKDKNEARHEETSVVASEVNFILKDPATDAGRQESFDDLPF